MKELAKENPSLEEKIVSTTERGNEAHDKKQYDKALTIYQEAWDLLPESKTEWKMLSQWISSSFYNTFFDTKDYSKAKDWAETALKSIDSKIDTSPLINLGMVCKELGRDDEAYSYFDQAYQYGKERAFKERPKKYLDFYLKRKSK